MLKMVELFGVICFMLYLFIDKYYMEDIKNSD